jgi:hypothetical protein
VQNQLAPDGGGRFGAGEVVIIRIVVARDAGALILEGRVGIGAARLEGVCMAGCIEPVPQGVGRKRGDRGVSGGRRGRDWTGLGTGGRLEIARGGGFKMAGSGWGRHWVGWL